MLHEKESKMSKHYFDSVPSDDVIGIQLEELISAFNLLKKDWEKYLKESEIKLPTEKTNRWYQLAVLQHFKGRAVHKKDTSMMIAKHTGKPASDQQVRHLKTQGGWYVLNRGDFENIDGVKTYNPDGCHVLITTESIHPNTVFSRRNTIQSGDWDEILKAFNHACASCGTKIGESHRFDPSLMVTDLQQGHMDPDKPLEAGNAIPQCRWCNQTARADFVFDETGRPRAVANIRPVKRASKKVITSIKKWLLDE